MSECDSCRLHGRKCVAAQILGRAAALSLYGLVLALIGGTIIWASISMGASNGIALLAAVVFLGMELVLFMQGGQYALGLLITAILFGPLIQWIKRQASYSPISKTGSQIIRDALLVRNAAV